MSRASWLLALALASTADARPKPAAIPAPVVIDPHDALAAQLAQESETIAKTIAPQSSAVV